MLVPCARARHIWKYRTGARALSVLLTTQMEHDLGTLFEFWTFLSNFVFFTIRYALGLIDSLPKHTSQASCGNRVAKSMKKYKKIIQISLILVKYGTPNAWIFFRARQCVLYRVPNMTHRQHEVGTTARFSRARVVKIMGTLTTSTRALTSTPGAQKVKKNQPKNLSQKHAAPPFSGPISAHQAPSEEVIPNLFELRSSCFLKVSL